MTLFLTEHPLSLFAQTMVYTIHEIPIFIAMGVVGKGHPSQDTNPPGPMNTLHTKDSSWCLPVGTGPARLRAWPSFEIAREGCDPPHSVCCSRVTRGGEVPVRETGTLLLHWETPRGSRLGPGQHLLLCENLFPERKAKPFKNKPICPSGCGDRAGVFNPSCPLLSSPVLSSSLCCLGSLHHSSESLTFGSFLVTGGVLGAVFNALNYWLTMFRIR